MREQARRWPMFQEAIRRGRLLEEMLDALEISAGSAARERHGDAIGQARSTCISCPHTRKCEIWLERLRSGGAPQEPCGIPDFCLNARYLESCIAHAASRIGRTT